MTDTTEPIGDQGEFAPTGKPKFDAVPVLGFALAACAAFYVLFAGGGSGVKSLEGKPLPPISNNSDATWLNSPSPLSWAALKGKVVWLEFSFLH